MESDEQTIFVDGVKMLLHPYVVQVANEMYKEGVKKQTADKTIQTVEEVHEAMLKKFWPLAQDDPKIAMMLIPIMAYLRKAVRERERTAIKAFPLNT